MIFLEWTLDKVLKSAIILRHNLAQRSTK